ncbi:hypothetical protein EMIT048CA2_150107 [Pseudomonas chlororaphis]
MVTFGRWFGIPFVLIAPAEIGVWWGLHGDRGLRQGVEHLPPALVTQHEPCEFRHRDVFFPLQEFLDESLPHSRPVRRLPGSGTGG